MYVIQNLAEHLAKINAYRAERGLHPIKPNKWADFVTGAKQAWFTACIPKARTGSLEGMTDKAKALELLASVNQALKQHGIETIPASSIVELTGAR